MSRLEQDWFSKGSLDFEYKKYLALAYLAYIRKSFDEKKVFPPFEDLWSRLKELESFTLQTELMRSLFPKSLESIDLEKAILHFKEKEMPDAVMEQISAIVHYALPKFKKSMEQGIALVQEIEHQIEIEAVGILPLERKEGYAFLREHKSHNLLVYQYQQSVYKASQTNRSIQWRFIEEFSKSLSNTPEWKKMELSKRNAQLPHPAVYMLSSKASCPREEAFIPICKMVLEQHLEKK